jgi:hypothetical protein
VFAFREDDDSRITFLGEGGKITGLRFWHDGRPLETFSYTQKRVGK